ncbi:site-specific DNA-methyltransferase [Dongia sp.]|uniref:site-specific DNA-methyltransferase n=1 Tax=Dongia sp. TaxID=1977262 RepID=UPI0035B38D45
MPVKALRPDPRNARKHSAKQIAQLGRSIEAFGFNVPILIDGNHNVIAGHARLLACQRLGWQTVPTISLRHLSEAQIRAFMIADNRLAEIAEWDDHILATELRDLSLLDLEFDLDVIGFDMGEIDIRIGQLSQVEPEPDPADALPEAGPAVSRPGDLWLLGGHRLYCGSALEKASFERLMGGERAGLVFIDPPYNVPIDGHATGLGKTRHREFAMAAGEMSEAQFTAFLSRAFCLLAAASRSGSLHYICMDWRHIGELHKAGTDVYAALLNMCVWVKDNAGMGSFYRSQHELISVFKKGKEKHHNNVQLGKYGRNRTNVWNYPGANTLARTSREGSPLAVHPTVKPTALVADAILDGSRRNDIVLDSFLGSGTTLVAAERVGRRCFGMELDPLYVDTAIRRWQALTKGEVKLESTGRTYQQTAKERNNGEQ